MNTKPVFSLAEVVAMLDAEPLEVRNPRLSEQIDRAFEGKGEALLSSLAREAPDKEWDDMARYIDEEASPRNMEEYSALCFLYACFILCVEGEDDEF
jgi:hypothetical protein